MEQHTKNPAAVALGRIKTAKKAAASRINGQNSGGSPYLRLKAEIMAHLQGCPAAAEIVAKLKR